MEESAPKRRRTSPRTSVAAQADLGPAVSTTPPDDPPQLNAGTKRPSFASPTKASLERHNPEILRRRPSPPKRSRRDDDATASDAPTARAEGQLNTAATQSEPLKAGENRVESEGQSMLRSPARRPGARKSQPPKPRPLPPPLPEEEEEILDPFARRGLRRSPPTGVLPERIEPVVPEPELPPTPEQPDPVVSTPPSGIHNTPSRRPRRNRALAERIKSSSPLKNPPVTSSPDNQAPLPFKLPSKPNKSKLSQSTPAPAPTTAEIRGIEPDDKESEEKRKHDELLAELDKLKKDLEIALKENERMHEAYLAGEELAPPRNEQEIIDLVRRHTLPESEEKDSRASTSWLQPALDPISFLPFSKPSSKPPTLFPGPAEEETEAPPISHHPVQMSAEEELPYLQVLTPLTITSHIALIRNPDDPSPTAPLHQKHFIRATSSNPQGLFSARIHMTVNARTKGIIHLSVPQLDPVAAPELGALIEKILRKEQPMRSALANNVNVLLWAMGDWLRLSTRRAKALHLLEKELGGGKGAFEAMVERVRQKKRKRKRKKGRSEDDEAGEAEEDLEDDRKFTVKELLPFMGRTSMEYRIPVLTGGDGDAECLLRLQWRVGFDWTGEGKNEVSVMVRAPEKWQKYDGRGRLSGIPQLFQDLMDGGETPLNAVRTVACLLAGEQR
ncbi:hypothetical protein QBC47DRAFT_346873 [Echria macrotheca]|uniref:Uncharacterized protein n=1 Tax=Echria macrotheca TaxID=438768 RepID=A0AAJ0FAJ0_9PEZI|nr:hypothetical protein QBC47DRAFT_346873 [Echria macrotheca]